MDPVNAWFVPARLHRSQIQALAKLRRPLGAGPLKNKMGTIGDHSDPNMRNLEAEIERGKGGDAVAIYLRAWGI